MARTIPEEWTQSTGCLSSGDLWGWGLDNGQYADVLGAPTETSSCYPPDYQPNKAILYATDACPGAFTPACSTQANGNWRTICCPTAYQFKCDATTQLSSATMYCNSPYPSDAASEWITSRFTSLGESLQSLSGYTATVKVDNQGTPSPVVVTANGPVFASDLRGPGAVLWAMAVVITSTDSSSQSTTTGAATETGGISPAATSTEP
ncbi:hypothetical protein F5883DRAFT_48127 [Diaporthe sp. PMI_573]|nr:hypothetical protein F5883DRAFT_48127 [Diaporthaceae sp. PMI_573]